MHKEIIIAGFGGQGVLLIGRLLTYAGMLQGKEVTWFPAYGPEMRGGTCNCTVVISNKEIGSPLTKHPDGLIALNLPSLDRFEPLVKKDGIIVVNTSLINRKVQREDVKVVEVPANEIAIQCGNAKAANMVALGAFLGVSEVADLQVVKEVLKETFSTKPALIQLNEKALEAGYNLVKGVGNG